MEGKKYIDIHSHILSGVDDGAKSLEESIAMLKQAQEEGIGAVILTPHQKPDRKCVSINGIRTRIAQLQREMERQHIEIDLYPGSELLYSHGLRERLANGSVCTLAGSHYILVEFLPDEDWRYISDGLYDLACAGYWPVVAHVERCMALAADPEKVRELADMGCYIQINAGSITGLAGFGMKRTARRLLKEGNVHFVATDAHRESGKRSVQLEACSTYLYKKFGQDHADRLLWKNAEKILTDTEL